MFARTIAVLTVATAAVILPATLQAQGVDVRIGVPGFYGSFYSGSDYRGYGRRGYYDEYVQRSERYAPRRGPRVYGYVEWYDEPTLRVSPGGCGTYRYWNGSTCADARNR